MVDIASICMNSMGQKFTYTNHHNTWHMLGDAACILLYFHFFFARGKLSTSFLHTSSVVRSSSKIAGNSVTLILLVSLREYHFLDLSIGFLQGSGLGK